MTIEHDPNEWAIRQELRKYERDCEDAIRRIAAATDVAQVRRIVDVPPQAWISAVARSLPITRQLEAAGEERVLQLGRVELARIAAMNAENQREAIDRFRARVLAQLRGQFAGQYRILDREVARIERDLKKGCPPAP